MKENKSEQKTATVAEYVQQLRYEDLPQAVIEKTKMVILDTIGVMTNASQYQASRIAVDFIESLGGRLESTVIGNRAKNSCVNAAFANGVMGHNIELDDTHTASKSHPAAVITPAVLAIAEKENSSGKDLILATVAGYDVECRVSIALGPERQYAHNFHPTSVCGCFGAAVAAGKILNLNKKQFTNALGLSGCQASGLLSWLTEIEHMTKSFHTGIAARNGLVAALLAQKGYNGPPAIFDGQYNLFDAFSTGEHHSEELIRELGTTFEIMNTGFKLYASCKITHAPLDAFFMIMGEHNLSSEDIGEVTVKIPPEAVPTVDGNELLTHNMQYVLGVAAVMGAVTPDQVLQPSNDPRVAAVAKRVSVMAEPKFKQSATRKRRQSGIVTLITTDGRRFEKQVEDASGEPVNPIPSDKLEEKFINLAGQVLPRDQWEKILESVSRLEELENIGGLMRFCTR
jgi:2-methylcitrate dehydratase PrpD